MYIKNIKVNNFRNIENCNIDFDEKINFILGDNGQGKSNFLESIYYSNFYKSFRTKNNKDLINFKNEGFFLNINIINNKINNNLKIYFDKKNNKKILLNNKIPKFSNIYKIINSIIYYPAEINLLNLYPFYRRNLIDRSIFFIENEYINFIKKYNKILKQRNIFLKNKSNKFDPWKDQLIEESINIINKRKNYIKKINKKLDIFYNNNEIDEYYSIYYKYLNENNIKDKIYNDFKKYEEREKYLGYTLFGPHIDDFNFFINKKDIRKYSSEGQKKNFLLNYKYVQMLDYYEEFSLYPILLFDDLGSELDSNRRKIYLNKIIENSGQIFITSTHYPIDIPKYSKLYKIEDGVIINIK